MKNLLNNRWLVASLALGALTICGLNIVAPLIASKRVDAGEEVPIVGSLGNFDFDTTSPAEGSSETSPRLSKLDKNLRELGWGAGTRRDPFRPLPNNSPSLATDTPPVIPDTASVIETSSTEIKKARLPDPTIAAIAITGAARLAIVDGHVVKRGTVVDARNVTAVLPRSITLRGKEAGSKTVHISSTFE